MMRPSGGAPPPPLSSICEESDEYLEEEGERSREEEDVRSKLASHLHLIGHTARVQGLKELKELYDLVNSRLFKSKEEEEERLKRAETKVASFLEEDEDKEKKELRVFEKMEKLTGRPSFGSRASFINKFVSGNVCLDSTVSTVSDMQDEEDHVHNIVEQEDDEAYDYREHSLPSPIPKVAAEPEDYDDVDDSFALLQEGSDGYNKTLINHEDEDHTSEKGIQEVEMHQEILDASSVIQHSIDEDDDDEETEERLLDKLNQAKQDFLRMKMMEEKDKLENQKAQLEKESNLKMQKLKADVDKFRSLNTQYIGQIAQMEEKQKQSNIEWSKKSSAWNLQRTKMKKQIDELEKRCEILEGKLQKYINKASTKPSISVPKQNKRIQFQGDQEQEKRKNSPSAAPTSQGFGGSKTANAMNKEGTDSTKHNEKLSPFYGSRKSPKTSPTCNQQTKENRSPELEIPSAIQKKKISPPTENVTENIYPNGTRKYVFKSEEFTRTLYKNGDIKEERTDGSIHYFFASYGLRHYVYPNGLEMTTYKNGQVQRKNSDGTSEILYPNGCVKVCRNDGKEEYIFPDNTVYQTDEDGNTVILLPNGQKEIHSKSCKKRIFPDGTTKTVYSDGSTETTYANGRTRVKNSAGKLILDTGDPTESPQCNPSVSI